MKGSLLSVLLFMLAVIRAQTPQFGNEIPVTINGYTADAMEPHISPDGNALFFNSLNDGLTTSLYYAARVNDSTFNLVGPVPAVNQTVNPRLDAVASLDTANNFFWVSTRGYPGNIENLHRIRFLQSGYTNFGRLHGDFYISSPGWIIMDAAVNFQGDQMIVCNAKFNGCAFNMPCRSALALTLKVNDSTFNKHPQSGSLMAALNDTLNYIVYAPVLSKNGLELYFTRALINNPQTELCVSVRNSTTAAFPAPSVIFPMSSLLPEGPTVTSANDRMYYHRKNGAVFRIYMKRRTGTVSLAEYPLAERTLFFPNPNYGTLTLDLESNCRAELLNSQGTSLRSLNTGSLDINDLSPGVYFIRTESMSHCTVRRLVLLPH